MVPSERTVTIGVGHGKKAARNIDAFLRGESYVKPPKKDLATFDKLHLWYYTDVEQRPQAHVEMQRRRTSFEEVVQGLNEKEAVYEAKRCLSCGNCFECDGCYGACPEDAIIKLGPGKRYQYDLRPVHRLRGLLRAVSVPCHQHDPGAERRRLTGSDRRVQQ